MYPAGSYRAVGAPGDRTLKVGGRAGAAREGLNHPSLPSYRAVGAPGDRTLKVGGARRSALWAWPGRSAGQPKALSAQLAPQPTARGPRGSEEPESSKPSSGRTGGAPCARPPEGAGAVIRRLGGPGASHPRLKAGAAGIRRQGPRPGAFCRAARAGGPWPSSRPAGLHHSARRSPYPRGPESSGSEEPRGPRGWRASIISYARPPARRPPGSKPYSRPGPPALIRRLIAAQRRPGPASRSKPYLPSPMGLDSCAKPSSRPGPGAPGLPIRSPSMPAPLAFRRALRSPYPRPSLYSARREPSLLGGPWPPRIRREGAGLGIQALFHGQGPLAAGPIPRPRPESSVRLLSSALRALGPRASRDAHHARPGAPGVLQNPNHPSLISYARPPAQSLGPGIRRRPWPFG